MDTPKLNITPPSEEITNFDGTFPLSNDFKRSSRCRTPNLAMGYGSSTSPANQKRYTGAKTYRDGYSSSPPYVAEKGYGNSTTSSSSSLRQFQPIGGASMRDATNASMFSPTSVGSAPKSDGLTNTGHRYRSSTSPTTPSPPRSSPRVPDYTTFDISSFPTFPVFPVSQSPLGKHEGPGAFSSVDYTNPFGYRSFLTPYPISTPHLTSHSLPRLTPRSIPYLTSRLTPHNTHYII